MKRIHCNTSFRSKNGFRSTTAPLRLISLDGPRPHDPHDGLCKNIVHRKVIVTVVTTPHNAARFTSIFDRHIEYGFPIRLVQLQFPCEEAGVPDGCESLDMIPSLSMAPSFFKATSFLQQPVEKVIEELTPPPSCIISDLCLPYTIHIAKKFKIPRISFAGVNCFFLLCLHNLKVYKIMESIATESEYFVLPVSSLVRISHVPDIVECLIGGCLIWQVHCFVSVDLGMIKPGHAMGRIQGSVVTFSYRTEKVKFVGSVGFVLNISCLLF
ncbi:UDP-glycosyltransferase 73C6 [Spatholobus suberectus]|nr:UDP-glycosyltransferase 73C6 [Spatholobus suberectus]